MISATQLRIHPVNWPLVNDYRVVGDHLRLIHLITLKAISFITFKKWQFGSHNAYSLEGASTANVGKSTPEGSSRSTAVVST